MNTRFKKLLSLALALIFALGVIPFTALTAGAEPPYSVGEIIEFGGYPQSRVTDSATVAALNAKVKDSDWVSYGYYAGDGTVGSMEQGDWMKYCDIYLNGNKYRGVTFSQYRPTQSYKASSAENSLQDDHGYTTGINYWFLWETLRWRVLDPSAGLVLCESIIDVQAYQNETIKKSDNEYYIKTSPTVFANNYKSSSVRTWLNGSFYQTAFTSAQQAQIKKTTLNNDAYSSSYPQYGSASTSDSIFLLSASETLNTAYGFDANTSAYDPARNAQGTAYAKCQGIAIINNHSHWILRDAREPSNKISSVGAGGYLLSFDVTGTNLGIRPAFTFKSGIVFSPYSVGCEHNNGTAFVNNGDGTHSKKCTFCDLTMETAPHRMGRNLQTNSNGHLTDCPDCGVRFTYVHDDKGSVTTTAGNCVTPGKKEYHCSVGSCTAIGRTEDTGLDTSNHKGPYTYQDAVAATCSASGSTRGQFCTACNQWKVAPQTTDPDLSNHVNTEPVAETFSTCVTPGYTAGTFCNDCRQYISGHEEKALADHTWDYANAVFNWDGYTCPNATLTCLNDPSHTTLIDVTVTPAVTDPTCEGTGEIVYTAFFEIDGETYADPETRTETLTATDHDWDYANAVFNWDGYACPTATLSCLNDASHTTEIDVTVTSQKTDPTCEGEGTIVYTASFEADGETYTDPETRTETLEANGHDWNAPVWNWVGTSATATFVCKNGDHPVTLNASVTSQTVQEPTDTEAGKKVYTATVTFEGNTYTDTVEKEIPALNEGLCKWCGQRHEGFFGKILGFFHSVAYFFAHLFGRR